MDELKLKNSDNVDRRIKKNPIISVSDVIAVIVAIPVFMLLVYFGVASYTPQSILSFVGGCIVGWIIVTIVLRTIEKETP